LNDAQIAEEQGMMIAEVRDLESGSGVLFGPPPGIQCRSLFVLARGWS